VLAAARKHYSITQSFEHYPGIVTLHGLARMGTAGGDAECLAEARKFLLPFARGERQFPCNFPNYQCGGNASAWLLMQGELPEAESSVRHYAEWTLAESPRDAAGILCHPKYPGKERIFIDVAFAVSPFLLFAGLSLKEDGWVTEAWRQTEAMVQIFRNPENGLLHQCRGFRGPGLLSEDHWSRGNGWGAYALAELAAYLPAGEARDQARVFLRDLLTTCLAVQDERHGLWHQELTDPTSYIETSGSALILYALGVALELGLVGEVHRTAFATGVRALLNYLTEETDMFHVCTGCLSPGDGSRLAYMARPAVRNDTHGFGPMALAMGQAHRLGFHSLEAL